MNFRLPENLDEIAKIERHLHAEENRTKILEQLNKAEEEINRLQQEYIEADFQYKIANKELYGEYRFEKGNLNT